MRDYKEEIEFFYNKLVNREKFALGKFADGEWGAIKGTQFLPANGEWAKLMEIILSMRLLGEN